MEFQAVVLAAGKGSRMHSDTIKVLHPILGRPLIDWVVGAAVEAGAESATVVVGHDAEKVGAHLKEGPWADRVQTATQQEQLGTGHAVWSARAQLETGAPWTLIMCGDVPNLSAETIRALVQEVEQSGAPVAMVSAVLEDGGDYGRVVRGAAGEAERVVEARDANKEERAITEINTGVYLARTDALLSILEEMIERGQRENAAGEYYLTDLVSAAERCAVFVLGERREAQGVNTRADLARAAQFARDRVNRRHMIAGVTLLDPRAAYIEADVSIEPDAVIGPNVTLAGRTSIGRGAVIEQGCFVRDAQIEADVHLKASCYLDSCRVERGASIGPLAHLRPGADVGPDCKVGNFVELKKTRMERGAKASHLSYLGDATIGEGANVGAGTITCNYDGVRKHQTTIEAGAFVGTNTSLIAPITIGRGAYVGAGSALTNDVPDGALGVARGRQRNIEGWVERTKRAPKSDE